MPSESALYNAIMADIPLGYWPIDEAALASTVLDHSGNAHHGTPTDVDLGEDGVPPTFPFPAGYWDGYEDGSDKISMGADTWSHVSPLTVEATVRLDPNATSTQAHKPIFSKGPQGWNGFNFSIVYDSGNWKVEMAIQDDHSRFRSTANLTPGNSYHVVATFSWDAQASEGTTTIYINGQYDSHLVHGYNILWSATKNLLIGNAWDGETEPFHGWISNVALYSGLLSPTRIEAHYDAWVLGVRPPILEASQVAADIALSWS